MARQLERLFVWCGGALFVAALIVAAWLYAVPLGHDRPGGGWRAAGVNAALLFIFALHHSAFAREPLKRAVASVIPERLIRAVYVWIASSLLIMVCLAWRPVGGTIYAPAGWWRWVLALVQVAGVAVIAQAVAAIDALELAGIRNPKMTDEELQRRGVYGVVRHPIYLGWVLIVFGSPHLTGDRLAFAALTTTYLVLAMPWEERALERAFGPAYRRYKEQVRWRIIPYVY